MSEPPQDPLQRQIYERMQVKSSAELLKIWRKNDTQEWTPSAFAVIRQLLQERGVEVPPRKGEILPNTPRKAKPPVQTVKTKVGFSVFWGPVLAQLAVLILVAILFRGSQFSCVLPIAATLVGVASLILWLHFSLIRGFITANEGQLISIQWLAFTRAGWLGKSPIATTYAVEFYDHQGTYHKGLCKTGLLSRVSFIGKV